MALGAAAAGFWRGLADGERRSAWPSWWPLAPRARVDKAARVGSERVINAFLRVHKLTECYGPPSILLRLRLTEALIQPDLVEAWSPAQPKPKDVRENSLA
jgi:hypothetical protein